MLGEIEPMIIGLLAAFLVHSVGLLRKSVSLDK